MYLKAHFYTFFSRTIWPWYYSHFYIGYLVFYLSVLKNIWYIRDIHLLSVIYTVNILASQLSFNFYAFGGGGYATYTFTNLEPSIVDFLFQSFLCHSLMFLYPLETLVITFSDSISIQGFFRDYITFVNSLKEDRHFML